MKLKYEFVIQEMDDDFVAVAVGDDAGKFSGLIRFNQTGKIIFEELAKGSDKETIIDAICNEFESDRTVVEKEATEFIDKLANAGLLV